LSKKCKKSVEKLVDQFALSRLTVEIFKIKIHKPLTLSVSAFYVLNNWFLD
jgi:hypothetical protein